MDRVKDIVNDELFEWMREIRRRIHEQPETAYKEHRTAGLIAERLRELGIDHTTGVAGTGIVGRLVIDKKLPTVALRADMDALPVTENTGLAFASQITGVMHACGHDGHVAILLGAAALLKNRHPSGNVIFIFQPAEEDKGGAMPMIEEGILDGVDVIFGGHIENHYKVGEIGIRTGVNTAYTDAFEIHITGRGGHAARPHESIDAVIIANHLVTCFQTIVSREVDPLCPVVITVGVINAGTVHNAIAENAELKGTIRTTEEAVREQVSARIKKIASSLSGLYDAKIDVDIIQGYPPVINHARECDFARAVAERIFGKEGIISIPMPSLGGEDFSYYTQKVPGCFVRFGAAKAGHEYVMAHSPRFDFDEEVLRVGAAFMSEVARYAMDKIKGNQQ